MYRVMRLMFCAFCGVICFSGQSHGGAQGGEGKAFVIEGGSTAQGGLLYGHSLSDAEVKARGGYLVYCSSGRFMLAIPPSAGEEIVLFAKRGDRKVKKRVPVTQRRYEVEHVDGLPQEQISPPESVWERIQKEREQIKASRDDTMGCQRSPLPRFSYPVRGRISGVYGSRRVFNGVQRAPHFGLDIAAPQGTKITAPLDGRVILTGKDFFYAGNIVILDHGMGLSSLYAHMDSIAVSYGDMLRRGDVMGEVGATGRATGPHLHWGINLGPWPLDPALLLVEP
ncbi:MAG: M23 family metallopeptidase [Alphaproteobacteria bacterium GM7ARS4]|nr:M23 family metallopeptidase [Alphaproteobacteria bacterium GM7ARS4]